MIRNRRERKTIKDTMWHWFFRTFLVLTICFTEMILGLASDKIDKSFQPSPLHRSAAPVNTIEVINIYPHDADAFTQGLFFHDGFLYESTGLKGKSLLAQKSLQTGKTLCKVKMIENYFGEGATLLNGKIYQLTWKNEVLLIYDLQSLALIKTIKYAGEGWGLATDGKYLLMSNGSSTLTVRHPLTLSVIREINVVDGNVPVAGLNELEFIQGEIWANIFMRDDIARISPKDGKVIGWLDLSILRAYLGGDAQGDVINGIAYDPQTGRIFVTGKFWPKVFEIRQVKSLNQPVY